MGSADIYELIFECLRLVIIHGSLQLSQELIFGESKGVICDIHIFSLFGYDCLLNIFIHVVKSIEIFLFLLLFLLFLFLLLGR